MSDKTAEQKATVPGAAVSRREALKSAGALAGSPGSPFATQNCAFFERRTQLR